MLNRLHADAIDEHCQRSGPLCSTCSHRRCTRLEAQRKSDGRPVHVGTRSVATSPANRSPVREQLRVNDACTSQWSSAGVLEPRLGHCNAVRIVVRLLRVMVCVRACVLRTKSGDSWLRASSFGKYACVPFRCLCRVAVSRTGLSLFCLNLTPMRSERLRQQIALVQDTCTGVEASG
jgi:hypothetical protein